MSMRLSNFRKSIIILLFCLSSSALYAQEVKTDTIYIVDTIYLPKPEPIGYAKRAEKIQSKWQKLIPSYSKAQFAGSMGLISVGTGWNYGKNKQWETDLLFGIVPRYSTEKVKVTMTLKQNFIPWSIRVNDKIDFKPFSTGLYLNTIFAEEFWRSEPSKYPNSYYKFSTKMRFNIFVGQGWEYKFDTSKKVFCKSITFFYEISTNELYLISAATNKYLKAKDFLGLSLGIKLQFL